MMPGMEVFSRTAEWLQEATALTGPQARGVLHLVLKEGGFDARQVNPIQMMVVLRRLMPKKLEGQGVQASVSRDTCEEIARKLDAATWDHMPEAAVALFDRVDQRGQR